MCAATRKKSKSNSNVCKDGNGPYKSLPTGLRCSTVLRAGVGSIAGAAELAVAAVGDMLSGSITPKEAGVVVTASGHVLRACALRLRYAKASDVILCLPAPEKKPAKSK